MAEVQETVTLSVERVVISDTKVATPVTSTTELTAPSPDQDVNNAESPPHAVTDDEKPVKETEAHAKDAGEAGESTTSSEQEGRDGETDDTPVVENTGYAPKPNFSELIPGVRIATYTEFKNFYKAEDMQYIVQALKAGVSLKNYIQKEKDRRSKKKEDANQKKTAQEDINQDVLHRIRIHSPCILQPLHRAAGRSPSDPMTPYTFCRPFKVLIHYHPQMKEALSRLEEKWGSQLGTGPNAPREDNESSSSDASKYIDSKDALLHMRTYVKFVEDEVLSLCHQYEPTLPPLAPARRKVLFSDLWYLFREGDWVYSPVPVNKKRSADIGPTTSNSALQASYQTCWRVFAVITPETPSDPDSTKEWRPKVDETVIKSDDDAFDEDGVVRICCYYIDYDGDSYGPVTRQFQILPFVGERDILSLPIYPTSFLPREKDYFDSQQKMGEKFTAFIGQKHLEHYGWTLTLSPTGSTLDDVDKYPEHIESEVIVDFNEAFQSLTSWKPEIHLPRTAQVGTWRSDNCSDESVLALRWNKARNDSEHVCITLHRSDDVSLLRRNQFLSMDQFLVDLRSGEDAAPTGDDLRLLPRRLVVYSLLERKFINADVNCLKKLRVQSDIFDKLSINMHHKSILRSLVNEHFRKKKRRNEGKEVIHQDLIRGKGTGLVFLLHGVPGVGKTATAEAIAQENKKPLFAITCGDLGFEPGDVEKNLTRIFRLANLWDCILLLDEADIFFTKRAPTDLQRNALVTVFLRILEYYSGILFLTTNRVGIIDEAFKSRIHMSLYYPPLTPEQYRRIFDVNLERIHEIEEANGKAGEQTIQIDDEDVRKWADRHYRGTTEYVGRWNGRQIRNAFQIATSLTHYELLDVDQDVGAASKTRPPNSRPGWLTGAQLQAVADATQEFDNYMVRVRKGDDGWLAVLDKSRDDRPMRMPFSAPQQPSSLGYSSRNDTTRPYQPSDRDGDVRYPSDQYPYRDPPASHWQGEQYDGRSPRPPTAYTQDSGISLNYGRPPPSETGYALDRFAGGGRPPPEDPSVARRPSVPPSVGAEPGYGQDPPRPYSPAKAPASPVGPENAYRPGPPPAGPERGYNRYNGYGDGGDRYSGGGGGGNRYGYSGSGYRG